jgi:concanavalin A-like lectin/glucanase superfamily protein
VRIRTTTLAALLTFLLSALPALATVTVVARYHLGEGDVTAVSGGIGQDPTTDSVGGFNLARFGSPTYTLATPFSIGSTYSMSFNGVDQRYGLATNPSVVTDNFGIEAWFQWAGNASGNAVIAYNGHTGTSGWGVFRAGGNVALLFGGVNLMTGPAMVVGSWTELAAVRAGGTTTLYVDGFPQGTIPDTPNAPSTLGGAGMMIGGNAVGPGEFFGGNIDEVRVFTFAPGAFTPSDLNLATANIPTAGTAALIAMALLLAGAAVLALRR